MEGKGNGGQGRGGEGRGRDTCRPSDEAGFAPKKSQFIILHTVDFMKKVPTATCGHLG